MSAISARPTTPQSNPRFGMEIFKLRLPKPKAGTPDWLAVGTAIDNKKRAVDKIRQQEQEKHRKANRFHGGQPVPLEEISIGQDDYVATGQTDVDQAQEIRRLGREIGNSTDNVTTATLQQERATKIAEFTKGATIFNA